LGGWGAANYHTYTYIPPLWSAQHPVAVKGPLLGTWRWAARVDSGHARTPTGRKSKGGQSASSDSLFRVSVSCPLPTHDTTSPDVYVVYLFPAWRGSGRGRVGRSGGRMHARARGVVTVSVGEGQICMPHLNVLQVPGTVRYSTLVLLLKYWQ
jgi:hypothetical protein